jgi:LmbE family N-acetylglucosaminyl deacetylase
MPRGTSCDSLGCGVGDPSRRIIRGVGTAESAWARWGLESLPDLALGARHVVVVAPHPDDEILGPGGTLAVLARGGAEIEVVAMTDGELGAPAGRDVSDLASVRRRETIAALARLLGTVPAMHHLGLPDGSVGTAIVPATAAVRSRLRPESLCLAPHRADGHPDHEAAFTAAAAACADVGSRLVEYPIWLWHWASPRDLEAARHRLRKVALPHSVQASKRRAIQEFASQLSTPGSAGILPDHVVARFHRPFEVFAA